VLGWEVGVAFSSFLAGTQIQGMHSMVLRKLCIAKRSDASRYRLASPELS
jgi:hypothetical protein